MDKSHKILFLTLAKFDGFDEQGLYKYLVTSLIEKRHEVTVVSPLEKRFNLDTNLLVDSEGNKILRVKIGNITKTKSRVIKGLSTILLEFHYLRAIKKHLKDERFDMLIYSTPPITFNRIIKHYKNKYNLKTYLMLKDIFPQNAVDLEMMTNTSLIYRYFRKKEIELYKLSDTIGCMSKANIKYLLDHNKYIKEENVELFPNAMRIQTISNITSEASQELKRKYNIPENSTIFIYGGNLGKPQGIDFLIEVINNFYKVKNSYLLIIGDGTEYNKIEQSLNNNNFDNVALHKRIPKEEYDSLIKVANVGLIFLDKRFTIPNFPSRLLSYMENSMPILAATDTNTDIGEVIVDSNSGYWVESGDLDGFLHYANKLSSDKLLISQLGKNARNYLEENYDIDKNIQTILEKVRTNNEK